jgi:hypothetical protein
MEPRKRNAIILCGFLRNYEKFITKFKSNIHNHPNVDLFICCWDTINYHDGFFLPKKEADKSFNRTPNSNKIDISKVRKDYEPTKIQVYNWKSHSKIWDTTANTIASIYEETEYFEKYSSKKSTTKFFNKHSICNYRS